MASLTSSPLKTHHILSPSRPELTDEDPPRGRKRRRSSAAIQPCQVPSAGSALRGRGRRRSLSLSQANSQDSPNSHHHRSASPNRILPDTGRKSPGKKYLKKFLEAVKENRRRSQSPSRSRSAGQLGGMKPRRRQRTRSRSRNHEEKQRRKDSGIGGVEGEGGVEVLQVEDVAVED